MKMMTLALLLFGVLAFAPPAQAQQPDLPSYQVIARQAFPTACEPTVSFDNPTAGTAAADFHRKRTAPTRRWQRKHKGKQWHRYQTTCILYIGQEFFGSSFDPAYQCTMVVHEYGHLAGLGHVADPYNIMYPGGLFPWPACKSAYGSTSDEVSHY